MIFGGLIGALIFNILAPIMIGIAVYELLAMLNIAGVKSFPTIGGLAALLVTTSITFSSYMVMVGMCFLLAIIAAIIAFFLGMVFIKEEKRLEYIGRGVVTIGATLLVLMIFIPLIGVFERSSYAMLFLVLTTKMMDTGGYIFGMLSNKIMPNGNHKIFPTISPKKSYEGTIGGIIFSVAAGLILYHLGYSPFNLTLTVISSITFAIGSFAGDLTESAIKRCCGVKDSGNIIPGMGGVFDVLDSFIYNGIIFSFILIALGC